MQHFIHELKENTRWLIEKGYRINFWLDNWYDVIIIEHLIFSMNNLNNLKASIITYIHDMYLAIPPNIFDCFS